jgi:hypothetical protein
VRFELDNIRCLEEIAVQTREIADSIILWLEETGLETVTSGSAVRKPARHTDGLANGVCHVTVSATDSPCKALVSAGTIPPREALRLKPSDDGCVTSRGFAETVPTEEFTQARLMGLQQRVCELLVKNQQLRLALVAERADSHEDNLC